MKTRFALTFTLFLAFLVVFPCMVSAQAQTAKFILTPDKSSVSKGDTLEMTIKLNTGEGNGVNSYQAHLTYPEDQLTFESVNTEGSPFNMALEAKGGNGKINIVRGSTTTQTGELLVGTVKFTAKTSGNTDLVKVSNDSAIIKTPGNINILEGSTIQNKPGVPAASDPIEKPKFSFLNFLNQAISFFTSLFKK